MQPQPPDQARLAAFHQAMEDLYQAAARDCKLIDYRFLVMVRRDGGLGAAKALLNAGAVQPFLARLWECQRLDLSVEALVLRPDWRDLFTADERRTAWQRLRDHAYQPVVSGALVP